MNNSLRRSAAGRLYSAVTRRRRSVAKPPTISFRHPINKCSLIGQIASPVRKFRNEGEFDKSGVYTFMNVKDPIGIQNERNCSFLRICLAMRGELAEICLEHLKPKEFVYVFGRLCSYNKLDASGTHNILYKVEVCELNYVKMNNQKELQCENEDLQEKESIVSPSFDISCASSNDVNYQEKNRDRLILWQIFFANPYEWRDCRAKKPSRNFPDFRHKNSGEALWINPNDPPWIKKQLKIYDSNISGFKHFWKNENRGFDRWKFENK